MLYNGKSLVEDGQFALEVMEHINAKVNEYKEKDGNLYAIYGTPAENLCGLQIKQFRNKYGITLIKAHIHGSPNQCLNGFHYNEGRHAERRRAAGGALGGRLRPLL